MGTWGPGLYANDLGKDLKSTIASVVRLPLEPAELMQLLAEAFPGPSSQAGDEEYSTFWLVVADQLQKKGIQATEAFQRAIEIIDSGSDLACPERLEMSAADRRKREKVLLDLRLRLVQPPPAKKRKTLTKPEPLLMRAGEIIAYPVYRDGRAANPYFAERKNPSEGWGAAIILRSEHVFGYLACYWALVCATRFALDDKPTKDQLMGHHSWELRRPGTCPLLHYARLGIDKIGDVNIDDQALARLFPGMRDGRYQAVNDITVSEGLSRYFTPDFSLDRLDGLLVCD